MNRLIKKTTLVILIALMLSVPLYCQYLKASNLHYAWLKNLFILPEIENKYDIVAVGSSHSQDGITFRGYRSKSLSLASVAQTYEFDLAHLKMHSRQIKKGAVVLINISPISFSQKKSGKADSLQTKYYDGMLSPLLIPRLKVGDYLQSQIFPFVRAGFLWRQKHEREIQDRLAAERKAPEPTPTPFPTGYQVPEAERVDPNDAYLKVEAINNELKNPSVVPADILNTSVDLMVRKWNNPDEFSPEYFETNRKDLAKLIDYCLEKQWRPVLISIPMSQALVDSLQQDYLQVYVNNNLAMINVVSLDYYNFQLDSRLVNNQSLFSNSDHLNKKGALVFSYLLMQKLIEGNYLSPDADGYDYGPLDNILP